MASNDNVHITEVEEVFEALSALELSQINESADPNKVIFTEAKCDVTKSSFDTPRLKVRRSAPSDRSARNNPQTRQDRITSPLTTYRLKPISERIRGTNVSIGDTGAVCLELYKHKNGIETLTEMFTVTQDGLEITVCHFNTSEVTNDTGNGDRRKVYTLDNLPIKFHKKYEYCRRFVNLVKSKSPKVIIYNQQAKCMLMENFPDPNFMAKFYNGQTFISTWQGMKLVNQEHGSVLSFNSTRNEQQFSYETQQIIKFAKQCQKQCLELEGLIKSNADNSEEIEKVFPIILGRRKSPYLNQEPSNTSRPLHIDDLLNTSESSDHSSNSDVDDITRQITLPNIGTAQLFSSGDIKVNFKDGCHMKFNPTDELLTFIDDDGVCYQYYRSQPVPNYVKCKMAAIPNILHHLNTQSNSHHQPRLTRGHRTHC